MVGFIKKKLAWCGRLSDRNFNASRWGIIMWRDQIFSHRVLESRSVGLTGSVRAWRVDLSIYIFTTRCSASYESWWQLRPNVTLIWPVVSSTFTLTQLNLLDCYYYKTRGGNWTATATVFRFRDHWLGWLHGSILIYTTTNDYHWLLGFYRVCILVDWSAAMIFTSG